MRPIGRDVETLFVALRVLVVLGVIVTVLWLVQRRVTKGRTSSRGRRGNAVTVVGRQGVERCDMLFVHGTPPPIPAIGITVVQSADDSNRATLHRVGRHGALR